MNKSSADEPGASRVRTLALPLSALTGAIALVVVTTTQERILLADGGGDNLDGGNTTAQVDSDHDGIPDAQEMVLGTDPANADSDNDGFSDLEELARQSDPGDDLSLPVDTPVNVGLAARTEDGVLSVLTAVYMRHTETGGFNVDIGILADGKIAPLPSNVYLANAAVDVLPGAAPGDVIGVLQTPYPESVIHDLGAISFYSTVTATGDVDPSAADAIDLVSDPEGPTLLSVELDDPFGNFGFFVPLTTDAPTPSWTPGQLCEQSASVQGNFGEFIEHRIETATCEPADGYCSPTCPNLSGMTYQTIDPLALLGG